MPVRFVPVAHRSVDERLDMNNNTTTVSRGKMKPGIYYVAHTAQDYREARSLDQFYGCVGGCIWAFWIVVVILGVCFIASKSDL